MKYKILLLAFPFLLMSFKTDKPAYRLFSGKGKEVKFKRLVKEALEADVIFFGEFHNNPIVHWLQIELTTELFRKHPDGLILGAEMFEADNQQALNQYLANGINADSLKKSARLWPNFDTDYAPLLDFARENHLHFVATNIPRRYATMVFRHGFEVLDSLPENEKAWIAPLPIAYDANLSGYSNMLKNMGDMTHGRKMDNLPKAQAVKDATMAWFIHQNLDPHKIFIHYNGAYHSDDYQGIIWYLKRLNPEVKILTISAADTDDMASFPNDKKNQADFIVITPTNMTKTH
ncbi:MAG: ChaN family lipoprotein [Bacteroidales bacterium]|nr:ChaN family lipoprotein [Bacteroidales bacterium]